MISPDKSRAWLEIDREALRENVKNLESLLMPGSRLMPALKGNAYGHGAVLLARELNALGIRAFCVATAQEGAELREQGVQGEILILGYTHPVQFPLLSKYDLTQTAAGLAHAESLNACAKHCKEKMKVHVKFDTGMHRLGERSCDIDALEHIFGYEHLIVTGTYTHLCTADTVSGEGRAFAIKQGELFYQAVEELEKRGFSCGKKHLLASYGLMNYPKLGGDYVRTGCALYGVMSNHADWENCPVRLRPILSIKTRVTLTKKLRAGERAGYGLMYTAARDSTIAVLSVGYGDGIPRALSCGNGKVLIQGKEAPVAGRICMDQMTVDVTDIPGVQAGDIAVLMGVSGQREITVYDMAKAAGMIPYEFLSRLGSRPERILL